jgi:hypothetical protein
MKANTAINSHLSYEVFDNKLSNYENILRKIGKEIHILSPTHPMRLYLKKIMGEIKELPEDKLYGYFERRKNK